MKSASFGGMATLRTRQDFACLTAPAQGLGHVGDVTINIEAMRPHRHHRRPALARRRSCE